MSSSSFWSVFTGGQRKPKSADQSQQPQQKPTSPFDGDPIPSSDHSRSTPSSGSSFPSTSSFDYTPQRIESIFQGSGGSAPGSAFADPSQLHPLAGLDRATIEYLTLDDSASSYQSQAVIPSRGLTDDLCYGAGVTYLTALSLGGAWGMREGLARSTGQAPKLRLNSVLNAVTRRGPFLGNSAGVVAIIYNLINWSVARTRGKHDSANTVMAGALSGMLFKSTRGLRTMLISGGIVGSVAGCWAVFRQILSPVPDAMASESDWDKELAQ